MSQDGTTRAAVNTKFITFPDTGRTYEVYVIVLQNGKFLGHMNEEVDLEQHARVFPTRAVAEGKAKGMGYTLV